ncbi:two-component system, NarL family, sensor histidine kinase DesK [Actinopolyspora lacussalsi subsp. righensis]|uniref:Two-component system, NarL family, sensor histidine kinase DesK n=1 Tax=Actinopolyspora righensis TaxID=995060 RepID=A0A1I6XD48_9ACTN|nr:histidine kinase [Actinopolyspora righensis]SFT36053.1 two-component system, NarL family, sensor histidine kinase DesK [Actinopolyspora righensis]
MYFVWESLGTSAEGEMSSTERGSGTSPDVVLGRFVTSLAPRLANGIVVAVFCAIGLVSFISVLAAGYGSGQVMMGLGYLIVLLGLQLGYFSWPGVRLRPSVCYPALLTQAGLVYLPMLQFSDSWIGLPGLLAGSILLTLRPSVAVPVFVVIVTSMGVLGALYGRGLIANVHLVVSAVITGLVVYGLTRLAGLVGELYSAREELARLAVAEERLRFARDLHDLLGPNLSAITLKSEISIKALAEQPETSKREMEEVLEISRKALNDTRSVASAYSSLSLEDECRSARSILTAAEVDVRVERDGNAFSGPVDAVLATVLREGVANVLRHSKAEVCEISVQTVDGNACVDIVNDGLPRSRVDSASEGTGNGIDNLSHRVGALGGTLTAGAEHDDWYRLRVTVPLTRTS